MPRKQRFTAHRIFVLIRAEGFVGGESTVRAYVRQKRPNPARRAERFLPLAFDPGEAAEADWGEAEVEMADQVVTVQSFALRLCYSRRMLVCAYPTQKQESFFDAHVRAFAFFGSVPRTIAYDNLKRPPYIQVTYETNRYSGFRRTSRPGRSACARIASRSRRLTPSPNASSHRIRAPTGASKASTYLTTICRCWSVAQAPFSTPARCASGAPSDPLRMTP